MAEAIPLRPGRHEEVGHHPPGRDPALARPHAGLGQMNFVKIGEVSGQSWVNVGPPTPVSSGTATTTPPSIPEPNAILVDPATPTCLLRGLRWRVWKTFTSSPRPGPDLDPVTAASPPSTSAPWPWTQAARCPVHRHRRSLRLPVGGAIMKSTDGGGTGPRRWCSPPTTASRATARRASATSGGPERQQQHPGGHPGRSVPLDGQRQDLQVIDCPTA